jgi:DNA-binding NtrC family response regulator
VRELESTIERLVVLAPDAELTEEHLAQIRDHDGSADAGANAPEPGPVARVIQRHVTFVLRHTNGNKVNAAKILGIDLSTLYRWQQRWK